MTRNDLAKLIYDYWIGRSPPTDPLIKPTFRDVVAFGILGNQQDEYSFDEWPPLAEPAGYGIMAWDLGRRQTLMANTGIDVKTADPLDQQRALWWELRHRQVRCLFAIQAAQLIEDEDDALSRAVAAISDLFEYSSSRERDKAKRLEYALSWRDTFREQKAT